MRKSIKPRLRRVPFLVGLWRFLLRWRQQDFRRKWLYYALALRNTLFLGRLIKVQVGGVSFHIAPRGAVAMDLWSGLRFERHELELILSIARPDTIFFDVGANTGLFSLAIAQKVSHARVYAFEPCAWSFKVLMENIRFNGLDNVMPIRTAIGDYTGEAVLLINAKGKDGLNTIGSPTRSDCKVVGHEKVPIVTLDAFVKNNNISRVDVMKVDVEGAELLIFRGAEDLLRRSDAPLVLYEGYSWCTKGFGYHPVEIMWLLKDYGYLLFVLDGESERVVPWRREHGYDAMIMAAKPRHPLYGEFGRDAQ